MKNFRAQLTQLAIEAELEDYDISDHIEEIKNKMKNHAIERKFTISLFKSKPNASFAIGASFDTIYQTFIPDHIEPHVYMKLFITALKDLGFADEAIEKSAGEEEEYYYYTIKVRW
jgi:hypothetical protein